jgi:hypothetical protein
VDAGPRPTLANSDGNSAKKKPASTARELGIPVPAEYHELDCQECGGTGFDPGSLDPFGYLCPRCHGAKKELVRRDYLAEAFQICAQRDPQQRVERAHLIAIVEHCRAMVSAAVSLPEVAA